MPACLPMKSNFAAFVLSYYQNLLFLTFSRNRFSAIVWRKAAVLLFYYFVIGLLFIGRDSSHHFLSWFARVLEVIVAEDLITLSTLISPSTTALPPQTMKWMLGFRSQLPTVRLSFEVL